MPQIKTDYRSLIDHTAHEDVLGYDPAEYPRAGTSWTRVAIWAGVLMAAALYGLGALLGALVGAGR